MTAQEIDRDEYLKRLVRLLVEHYQPVKIYLFGSKARGDEGLHSDYDLMVLVRGKIPWTKRKRFHYAKWDAGLRESTDIILFSEKTFEEQRQVGASLPAAVVQDGKLLYEAA